MSRIEEIKKHGYTIRLYGENGKAKRDIPGIKFYVIANNIMTLFDLELKIVCDIDLKEYTSYNLITKAV